MEDTPCKLDDLMSRDTCRTRRPSNVGGRPHNDALRIRDVAISQRTEGVKARRSDRDRNKLPPETTVERLGSPADGEEDGRRDSKR